MQANSDSSVDLPEPDGPGDDGHPAERDLEVDVIERGHDVAVDGEAADDAADFAGQSVIAERDLQWATRFHASPPSLACA